MDIRGISRVLPKDGQNITNYINCIDLANEERTEYFVPFSANYLKYSDAVKNTLKRAGKDLKDARINYFTKNGIGQLTLEYNVFDGENITPQKLVLAIGEMNEGKETTRREVQEIMKNLLLTAKNYSQVEGFEKYMARIQKLGWTVTNECIDIAGVSKPDGVVDIRRTNFTQQERENITREDIEQNQKDHSYRVEAQFINSIQTYIIDGYEALSVPMGNANLSAKKKEVMKYKQSRNKGEVDEKTLLGATFTKMNPLIEIGSLTPLTAVAERACRKVINNCLESLPDTGEIEQTYIKSYLQLREEYTGAKEDTSKAKAKARLQEFIEKADKRIELQRADKRKELREYVESVVGNVKEYQEEDIETERKLGEKEKEEELMKIRKKTGPSVDEGREI